MALVESLAAQINALEARVEVLENKKSSIVQYGSELKGLMVYFMER